MRKLGMTVALLALALPAVAQGQKYDEIAEVPAEKYFIPPAQLRQLESRALSGDPAAALRISRYHGVYKYDFTQETLWLQIAAENDGVEAQYELAAQLLNEFPKRSAETVERDRQRACFWLRKATTRLPTLKIAPTYLAKCSTP